MLGRAILAIAFLTVVFQPAGAAAAEHWERLFNGNNLDGWEAVNGGAWSVEDGAIAMRRLPGNGGGAWLFTRKDYGDFILRLKFMPNAETFHSGVVIREPAHGKITRPAFDGYEVSLAQGIRHENTTGAIYFSASAYENTIPAHEWTAFEIRCVGDHITTLMNGRELAETHTRRSFKGGIGLHLHGGDFPTDYRWKDIEIEELPPAPRDFQFDEEKLAQMPGDFQPVADFTPSSAWTWREGVLHGEGAGGESWITGKASYANFILTFDFKVSSGGSAGASFRIPADPRGGYEFRIEDTDIVNPTASIFNLARAFLEDVCEKKNYHEGKWNQGRVYAVGDHVITYLNQEKGAQIHSDRSAAGRFAFRVGAGSSVDFRNIQVKRIP
jgi:hypothetical protein